MPFIRTISINNSAKIGIWHITEQVEFFTPKVVVERTVHNPHKRLQHLAARYMLSELEPGFPLHNIKIASSNKPYIPGNSFHFSLAHCGDYAAAIISRHFRVGIDVEKISSKVERVAHKFLNPEELAFINPQHYLGHLTLCWCAKEAVFKWDGDGGMDFREYIHLQPFAFSDKGNMLCHFQKNEKSATLVISYFIENDYCVAWLVDENK